MDTTAYTTLTRQSGLMQEMQVIANNIANAATTGFRQEGVTFSEFITDGGRETQSMAYANLSQTDFSMGALAPTGNTFDLAIDGGGFFQISTANGERLTRNGQFTLAADGQLVNQDGNPVLDVANSPIFLPMQMDGFDIGSDGTISNHGQILAQIGVVRPSEGTEMIRENGLRFIPQGDIEPVADARVTQGFLEKSNTDPILQMARMIQVQRAYELGQSFQDAEDKRIRAMTQSTTS